MDGLYLIVYFTIVDILKTYISPFFILMLIIIYFQYRGIVDSPVKATITSMIYGSLGGIIATILFIYLRIYIIPKDFIYIFFVAILLSLVNTRFMCFAYGGSIVALGNLLTGYPDVDPQDIMTIVAVFHLIESVLIFLNGRSGSSIGYFNLNGKVVQGYNFNRFWALPFVIFIGDTMIRPMTLIAILNYGDFTLKSHPKIKTIKASMMLCIYSMVLFLILIQGLNPFIAPLFGILGHEFIVHYSIWREKS